MLGSATETLEKLIDQQQSFDLILIDADKKNYETYLGQSLSLLRSTGIILVDNVLWAGKVTENDPKDLTLTRIQEFNEKTSKDERIEKCLLPIGDGMLLIRKKD